MIAKFSKVLLVVSVLLTASLGGAQTKKKPSNSFAVQDSLRRQGLQASAKEWFEKNYLFRVRQVLNPIDSYGVTVTEPRNVLPPDLGGPLKYTQITVDAQIQGWNYSDYRYSRYFSSFPQRGWAQCRFRQQLWATINAQGMPVKIMSGQEATGLVACGSSSYFPPEYHGIRRPKF